ncbi:MAG: DUF3795 domain-containing protein [Desulfobacter sp.]|nr:MAG: DUF3795 domain-containing protein [Desulfobacter sp.]
MKRELNAPCGLYCGVCGVYVASWDKNRKLKDKLAGAYKVKPEEIECKGCLSDEKFVYCRVCGIRACSTEKGIDGCHSCDEFPCRQIHDFPIPAGKAEILRSVPERKKLGDAKWAEAERLRYTCPHCSSNLFRGAKRCGNCKRMVSDAG